jgi:hypothetical protein
VSETSPESAPPRGGNSPLVQPEGVNAGSAEEGETRDHGAFARSPRTGGDPAGAPGSAMELDQDPSAEEGDRMVGTTGESHGGQDDGSMG